VCNCSHIIVPRVITDGALKASAEYRSKGRLPAVVWRHPASGAVLVRYRRSYSQAEAQLWRSLLTEDLSNSFPGVRNPAAV
jgi:hypothetical protein